MNLSKIGNRGFGIDADLSCFRNVIASEAKQSRAGQSEQTILDCFVAALLAMTRSLIQRLALDGAAAQEPPLLFWKIGAGVDGAAVVPHQEVAELPDMLENEIAALADLVELIEDDVALFVTHT